MNIHIPVVLQIEEAGREHLHINTRFGQVVCGMATFGFGAAGGLGSVKGRDKSDFHDASSLDDVLVRIASSNAFSLSSMCKAS